MALPFLFVSIGIAFNMLKLIDVYYYVYYAETKIDPLVFINYMLFLPVFTSGPIFRYRDFIETYNNPLPLTGAEFTDDFKRIIRGYFKKVVLAAWLQTFLTWLLSSSGHWYISCLVVLCSYGILYFDLSGYTDIAIAFSRMAGFNAPENFKRPWAAPALPVLAQLARHAERLDPGAYFRCGAREEARPMGFGGAGVYRHAGDGALARLSNLLCRRRMLQRSPPRGREPIFPYHGKPPESEKKYLLPSLRRGELSVRAQHAGIYHALGQGPLRLEMLSEAVG
jgi:hypothetical protein